MADLTTGTIKATSNSVIEGPVQFGEACDPGELVYLKSSDSKYWLAVNAAEATAELKGLVVLGNSADGYGFIATGGEWDIGATLTATETYMASSTAGKIHAPADLASSEYRSDIGTGKTTALMTVAIKNTGVAKA
jgi:hypothetical protein